VLPFLYPKHPPYNDTTLIDFNLHFYVHRFQKQQVYSIEKSIGVGAPLEMLSSATLVAAPAVQEVQLALRKLLETPDGDIELVEWAWGQAFLTSYPIQTIVEDEETDDPIATVQLPTQVFLDFLEAYKMLIEVLTPEVLLEQIRQAFLTIRRQPDQHRRYANTAYYGCYTQKQMYVTLELPKYHLRESVATFMARLDPADLTIF